MATTKYFIVPHSTTYNAPSNPNLYNDKEELGKRKGKALPDLPNGEVSSEEMGSRISANWFSISRPSDIRDPKDTSFFLFGSIEHPNPKALTNPENNTALVVDMDFTHHVHEVSDVAHLANLYADIGVPGQERGQMISDVASHAGQSRIPMVDLLTPTIINNHIHIKDTLEAEGWFEQLGENLINDPEFNAAGNWTAESGWAVGGTGVALCDGTQTSASSLINTGIEIETAKKYRITYTIDVHSAGTIHANVGGEATLSVSAAGTYSEIVTSSTLEIPKLVADADFIGEVSYFAVQEVIEET